MKNLFDFGKAILESQPFSQLIGAELRVFEEGRAEIYLPVADKLKQQHGFVHGGAVSYLADNCLTYAGGSVLGDSVTSEYKINFVRPAVGDALVAKSSVISIGQTQAVCECRVYSVLGADEKLVAIAQGTIVRARKPAFEKP